jgi:hypothetical protein
MGRPLDPAALTSGDFEISHNHEALLNLRNGKTWPERHLSKVWATSLPITASRLVKVLTFSSHEMRLEEIDFP